MCSDKKLFKFITCCLLVLLFFLCGCWPGADLIGPYERDLSSKKAFWGGYAKDQQYILLHDVFLQRNPPKIIISEIRMYAGVPPRELTYGQSYLRYGAPWSIKQYMETPEEWPEVIGVIKAGTKVECAKVVGWGTLMWPMSHTIYAAVKDGDYTGILIDIQDLSCNTWVKIGLKEQCVLRPNPNLLKNENLREKNQ